MSSSNQNRPSFQARVAQAITGVGKRLQSVPSVVLAGVSYKPADLIVLFQSALNAASLTTSTKTKWQDAVKAERDVVKSVHAVLIELQNFLRNLYGNAADPLADFGFVPKKSSVKRTGQTIVQATAKSKATKTARHTLGKKQRKAIKGTPVPPIPPAPASPPTGSNGPNAAPAPSGTPQQGPSNGSAPHA
jgi:hypothetical protein